MKQLLLMSVLAISLVACERQQEANKAAKPSATTESTATKQTIIDNSSKEAIPPSTSEKTPEAPAIPAAPTEVK